MAKEEETGNKSNKVFLNIVLFADDVWKLVLLDSTQASDMMDTILEGYPKSKKEFQVGDIKLLEFIATFFFSLDTATYLWRFPFRRRLAWRLMKTTRRLCHLFENQFAPFQRIYQTTLIHVYMLYFVHFTCSPCTYKLSVTVYFPVQDQ